MERYEAQALGEEVLARLESGDPVQAYACLAPVLSRRTPFRLLDLIGGTAGAANATAVDAFIEEIGRNPSEGGWVVIGSTLRQRIPTDLADSFERCRRYAIAGGVWVAADILAERVPGPALVDRFDEALEALAAWRVDPNRWVHKMVGVATHFWAKRSQGASNLRSGADRLLDLLDPLFEERDLDAATGIGWGLKTLGRHYPDLVATWLIQQRSRPHRAVVMRKAVTYLPARLRRRVEGT